jgi:import inner membrane translocase subunit TIM50
MLPRAGARALRIRPALAAPRTCLAASPSQWPRTYASNNRRKDNTWKKTDPIKFDEKNKAQPNPVNPSEQPEFDDAAAPERNTTPTQPSRPTGSATEASKDAGKGFKTSEQEEFSGPKSPTENTDPTTESPESQQKPQKPLPDLRYGIPSTFGAEAEAEGKGKPNPEDPDFVEEPIAGGREGGELPKSAYETSTDRRRNRVANWSYLAMLLFGTTGAAYMGRNWESEEEEQEHFDTPNGWGIGQMYARAAARINGQKAYYTEPTFQKLLPDKDKIPGGAPELTLVLSLEDLLLHSEWSTKHGYRLAKRPGLDYFLRYLSSQYELVIFTTVKSMDADPIIRKLDPFRLVMWPLFREGTRFEKGEYIKVCRPFSPNTQLLTNSGPLLPQPRPLQGHHHGHRPLACQTPARERHRHAQVEGRAWRQGPRSHDPVPRIPCHDVTNRATNGCAHRSQVDGGQGHPH